MATDYISREAAIETIRQATGSPSDMANAQHFVVAIRLVPAADVVSRDCFIRILEENDTMREQLAAVGKKPGDKMDDVVKVVRCGERFNITDHDCPISWPKNENDFCSYGERRDK